MSKSDTRNEVLEFIQTYFKANSLTPTVREIAEGTGLRSTSTVHYHLEGLAIAGLIELGDGKSRAIKLKHTPGQPCLMCGHTAV
jgi:repressor LexA